MVGMAVLVMDALDLFTDAHALARATDPGTSKAGARDVAIRAGSQKARLLRAYELAGAHGLTDEEAGYVARMDHTGYLKRCSELRAAGLIVPTGEQRLARSGSMQAVHALAEDARRAA